MNRKTRKGAAVGPRSTRRSARVIQQVIVVDSDDENFNVEQLVRNEVDGFFKTTHLISDDEGDTQNSIIKKHTASYDDDVLLIPSSSNESDSITVDLTTSTDNWEEYKKTTSNLLQSVNKIFDELKCYTDVKQIEEEPTAAVAVNEDKSEKCCPVCLEKLDCNVQVMATRCGHIYCKPCIDNILKSNCKRCPTCRKKLTKTAVHLLYL